MPASVSGSQRARLLCRTVPDCFTLSFTAVPHAGEQYVSDGVADLVAYGVPYVANANLPELVAAGVGTAGLNPGRWPSYTVLPYAQ